MQPSSLVFVVVIGIWAAFLIQYWVRRREHLATARSVDRFSEAMRVLDRRSRAMQASAADGGLSGGLQTSTAISSGSGTVASSGSASLLSTRSRRSPLVARGPASAPHAGQSAGREPGASRPSLRQVGGATLRAARRGPSPAARRVRALGLMLAVAVVPVTVAATFLGLAPRWTLAVAFAEVGLCLVALRLAAVRAQTARHTDRSMRSSLRGEPAAARATGPGADGPAEQGRPHGRAVSLEGQARSRATDAGSASRSGTPSSTATPGEAEEPPPAAYRPGDPTWRPVPVPRPTYQLKDPAPPARRVRPSQQRPFDGREAAPPSARPRSSRRAVSG